MQSMYHVGPPLQTSTSSCGWCESEAARTRESTSKSTTTTRPPGSSGWTARAPPCCSTASCTRCATTASDRSTPKPVSHKKPNSRIQAPTLTCSHGSLFCLDALVGMQGRLIFGSPILVAGARNICAYEHMRYDLNIYCLSIIEHCSIHGHCG